MARKAKSTALEDSITEGFKIAHTPVAEENQTTEEAPATKKRTTKKKKAEEPAGLALMVSLVGIKTVVVTQEGKKAGTRNGAQD